MARIRTGPQCVHCPNRCTEPRGLCKTCYGKGEVRRLYRASTNQEAGRSRGTNSEYQGRSKEAPAVAHRPYSAEMMLAMQERVARGEAVRQPGDGTLEGWRPTAEEAAEVFCR